MVGMRNKEQEIIQWMTIKNRNDYDFKRKIITFQINIITLKLFSRFDHKNKKNTHFGTFPYTQII